MNTPLPSGYETNALERLWNQSVLDQFIAPYIAKNIYNVWQSLIEFLQTHAILIFTLIFLVGALNFAHSRLKKRQYNIQKLWQFIMFFLSKRMMMIPLLYTLGTRSGALNEEAFEKLLALRDKAKHHTMVNDPKERIKIEQEVSTILMQYFQNLEEKGELKENSVFYHLVDDLEYIDKKLVELQNIYNNQSQNWNKWFSSKFLGFFGFKTFKPFE